MAYYMVRDGEQPFTAFGKSLNDSQVRIKRYGITISDEDELQFYLEQMYASNHFDKKELPFWRVANSTHTRKQGAFQGPPRPS